jgi:hypothetical protein
MKRSIGLLTAAFAALTLGSTAAHAGLLTYTETVTASGSLDGNAFTNALVTLTLNGNTTNIGSGGSGIFDLIAPVSISVAGLTGDSFSQTIQVVDNQNISLAGFGDNTINAGILFTGNGAFATYDLSVPTGPISGSATINAGEAFITTNGSFRLDSTSSNAVFTVTATTSAVPEPGSLLLFATAFGLAFWKIKTKATA